MTLQSAPKPKTDWIGLFVFALLFGWVIGTTLLVQAVAAFMAASPGNFLQRVDITPPQIFYTAMVMQVILQLVPLLPFALWWRTPRYRAAFRTWAGAALFAFVLAPARLIPWTQPQLTMGAQLVLALLFAFVVWWRTGRGTRLEGATSNALAFALGTGLVLALPWILWGALGSIGDIAWGLGATVALAYAAATLLTRVWLPKLFQDSRGAGWDLVFGGLVVGTMLLVMGSAMGSNGTQLWFMLPLASIGWILMALVQMRRPNGDGWNDRALFALMALVIAAPMLLLDPKAGILLAFIGGGELLVYAFGATVLMVLGAWMLSVVYALLYKRFAQMENTPAVWVGFSTVCVIAIALYFFVGQPGFYGDQAFVILNSQADVSAAKNIPDYNARREFVYKTLTAHAETTQADLRANLENLNIAYTPYYLVNAVQVQDSGIGAWYLTLREDVDRVLPAPVMRPLPNKLSMKRGDETNAPSSPRWNLTMIGADRVWNDFNVRGGGVLVGQSDSGADGTHPELSAQYRGRDGKNDYNWLDPWFQTVSPTDIGGHGTHTLGSIVGKTVGVAPDAEWIGCVNLARNLGNPGLYLNCMQFLLAPYPQNGDALRDGDAARGAMVLNNSWGCPEAEGCDANALLPAVKALRDAGVFVVASAGNDGPGCSSVKDPIALYDDVFSVGAVNANKQLAYFSSRGPVMADASGRIKPDIVAPGEDVYSAFPGGTYASESGTSMAGPHIAGVVALLWSANPKLIGDIDRTEQILRETARPLDASSERIVCGDPKATPNDLTGYGLVDAYAAVQRALAEK